MKDVNEFINQTKEITPVIKRVKLVRVESEVCPHCRKEIQEKETYVDPERYVYHSPCMEKGPIDRIREMSDGELNSLIGGK